MPYSKAHFLCSLKIWINYFWYPSLTLLSQVSGSLFPALSAIRHAVVSWFSYTRITVQLCAAHTFVILCFSLPSFNWLTPQLLLTKKQATFLQLSPRWLYLWSPMTYFTEKALGSYMVTRKVSQDLPGPSTIMSTHESGH